jgi:hypothetical protein
MGRDCVRGSGTPHSACRWGLRKLNDPGFVPGGARPGLLTAVSVEKNSWDSEWQRDVNQ